MLVFIAPYPDCNNEQDGMIQRIASIDSNFESSERVYLDISLRRFVRKKIIRNNKLTICQLNFVFSIFTILYFIVKAKTLYIHSVYNALKVLPAFFFKKVITDMHGIVPEEMLFEGNKLSAIVYNWVEKITVRKSYCIICVTKTMKEHYYAKYGRNNSNDLIVPIITHRVNLLSLNRKNNAEIPLVIYAGGLQKWQNVPKMLEAVKCNRGVRYKFLTGKPDEMESLARQLGIFDLEVMSVAPSLVDQHYFESEYGFLLRDDILLNQVACPTKGIEYMANGVVPIVLNKNIGDFCRLGYEYITYDDFKIGLLPSPFVLDKMKKKNYEVIDLLINEMDIGLMSLRSMV